MPQPRARVLVSIVGQSNESGSGPSGSSKRNTYGAPLRDPVLPNGAGATGCSWWPRLTERVARELGVWMDVHNSAVGSSSIVHNWCGVLRTWTSSMLVTRGTYVLSGGGVWRCAVTAGTFSTSTVAPTGTSDTTGADSVPWVYVGAPGVGDIAGTVYSSSSSRWDPNGYLAAAAAPHMLRLRYDRRFVVVSLGQTDKTMSSSATEFVSAYANVVAYMRAAGVESLLGLTCVARTSGSIDYFNDTLAPAFETIKSTLLGNGVWLGANLLERLGVTCTLQGDNLHMDAEMYDQAADAWFERFAAVLR